MEARSAQPRYQLSFSYEVADRSSALATLPLLDMQHTPQTATTLEPNPTSLPTTPFELPAALAPESSPNMDLGEISSLLSTDG